MAGNKKMIEKNVVDNQHLADFRHSCEAIHSKNAENLSHSLSNLSLFQHMEEDQKKLINLCARHGFVDGLEILFIHAKRRHEIVPSEVIGGALINGARTGELGAVNFSLHHDPSLSDIKDALHSAIVQSIDPQWNDVVDAIWNELQEKHISEVVEDITADYNDHASMYGYQKWAALQQSKMLHQEINSSTILPPSSSRSKI